MGWSGGNELMSRLAETLQRNVRSKKARVAVYLEMIEAFESHDCDTLHECRGEDPALDEALGPEEE